MGSLVVDHLMEASEHVAACNMLEWKSSLHEETAFRDFNRLFLPITGPDWKAWVSRFAVDCHKADVVVEPSKNCALLVEFLKVWASWGK